MMRLRHAALVAALLGLAACGGGAAGTSSGALAPAKSSGPVQAQIRVVVPANAGTASAARRRALFVAYNTAGATVAAYTSPRAQHTTAVAQISFDVSAASTNCTATAGGGRTCTLTLALPASGTDDFVLTTYDTAPVSGAIPQTANQLGVGISAGVAVGSGTNTLAFSINGVVAAVAVQLGGPPFVAVSGATQNVNVQALDATQNTIVTDAYSDAQGNPASIALAVTGASSAHFQIAPASISSPAPNGVTLTFAPTGMSAAEFANGFAVTLTATPSNGGTSASSTTVSVPTGNQQFTTGFNAGVNPGGITLGPDNNIWFTDQGGAGGVGKITEAGTVTEFLPTTAGNVLGITAGPDGNLWFTEGNASQIGRITTAGVVTAEFPTLTAHATPDNICAGPDGNLWFTEAHVNKIGRITTAGVITEFTIPTPVSDPIGIAPGPDGALWFTEDAANQIGRITTSGTFSEYVVPTPNAAPFGITAGPDGALWFAENNASAVGRVTTGGTFSQINVSPAASVVDVATGSDGNIWASANGYLIRITTGGTATVLPNTQNFVPLGIVSGHDGNVWYSLEGTGIGKIVL